ncbi:MAG: hypothetical protein KF809_17835 [Chloroflexi bacterium]|nr:hypothetical protein [Chloroflexota bacterium]
MDELLAVLNGHGPYMSEADEAEIIGLLATSDDVADLAIRTCMCGRRLDGFDDYYEHLRAMVRAPAPSS